MKYLIRGLWTLAVLAVAAVIGVAVFVAIYFHGKAQAEKAYETTIVVEKQSCDFETNDRHQTWTLSVRTAELSKVKEGALAEIAKAGGSISSVSSDSSNYYYEQEGYAPYPMPPVTPSVSISATIPNAQKDPFMTAVRKVLASPSKIESEYLYEENESMLEQNCESAFVALQNLVVKERLYLDQLRKSGADENLLNNLSYVRQDASSYKMNLDNLRRSLGTVSLTLTIQEFPG